MMGASTDRLDPGQEAVQAVEVGFPTATKGEEAERNPYRACLRSLMVQAETAAFPVSIGGQ